MEDKKVPTRINAELIYYQLTEINNRLDKFEQVFVTKAESTALKHQIEELRQDLQESKTTLSKEISELKKSSSQEISELKKSRTIIGWIYPTATAVFTAIATYITIEFLRGK